MCRVGRGMVKWLWRIWSVSEGVCALRRRHAQELLVHFSPANAPYGSDCPTNTAQQLSNRPVWTGNSWANKYLDTGLCRDRG